MSKTLLKCKCGGSYIEGSDRHFKTKKHLDYLNELERINDLYSEIIALLCINKFGGADRLEKAKKYVEARTKTFKTKEGGLKALHREMKGLNNSLIQD